MKKLLVILFLFFGLNANSQNCVISHTGSLNPAGPYTPGQVVSFNYTLYTWSQININWINI